MLVISSLFFSHRSHPHSLHSTVTSERLSQTFIFSLCEPTLPHHRIYVWRFHDMVLKALVSILYLASIASSYVLPRKLYSDRDCNAAYDSCDFTFSGWEVARTYSLNFLPNEVFTGVVVEKKTLYFLGAAHADVDSEVIKKGGKVKEISQFGTPRLSGQHFKITRFSDVPGDVPYNGVGHESFHGMRQYETMKQRCFRIFFNDYQLFDANFSFVDNFNVSGKGSNCLVFKTQWISRSYIHIPLNLVLHVARGCSRLIPYSGTSLQGPWFLSLFNPLSGFTRVSNVLETQHFRCVFPWIYDSHVAASYVWRHHAIWSTLTSSFACRSAWINCFFRVHDDNITNMEVPASQSRGLRIFPLYCRKPSMLTGVFFAKLKTSYSSRSRGAPLISLRNFDCICRSVSNHGIILL